MLIMGGFAVFVLLVLFFLPIKKRVIIEGIFKSGNVDYDFFQAKKFKSFVFEDFCRTCVEGWRKTGKMPNTSILAPTCYAGIHCYSLDIGSIKPKAGDVVKLVGWQTIFERVRLYYFEKSDFVWTNYHDEEDRQEAQKRGFTDIQEYKRIREQEWHEECIKEFMEEKKLTRDEAEIFEVFGFSEIRDRGAKRLGKSIAELDEDLDKRLRKPICDVMVNGSYLAKRYLEEKSIHPDIHAHLNKCSWCNSSFVVALHRKTGQEFNEIHQVLDLRDSNEIDAEELGITVEQLRERISKNLILCWGHGEDCFTIKERIAYARTESLSAERLNHMELCLGCGRMLRADREDFVQTGKIGTLKMKEWRESKNKDKVGVVDA